MDATAIAPDQPTATKAVETEIADLARTIQLGLIRQRRLRLLSAIEIGLYSVGATAVWLYEAQMQMRTYLPGAALITALGSPVVLVALGITVIGVFSLILNGVTPMVSAIARLRDPYLLGPPSPPLREGAPNRSETEVRVEREVPFVPFFPDVPGASFDQIQRDFSTYISRSQQAKDAAGRRPNALLFVGTVIAVAGLVFFVLTLPGGKFAFIDVTPSTSPDLKADFWASAVQLLPRLLMLVFIQVLAGFFLRQYRSSIEDFRYYESVLRHREAQYLSYTLRKKLDDKRALLKFADELLKDQEFGRLVRGQSTIALETHRAEVNEFSSLYERLAALVTRTERNEKKVKKKTDETRQVHHDAPTG